MSEKDKTASKIALTIGVMGFIAGVTLLFTESWMIGIFGSIASAGLVIKGYQGSKT